MSDINLIAPVAGTDGKVPVYDPDGRWNIWALQEIYIGQQGDKRYVPKVNDYVYDYESDEKYRVLAVDPTTLISTLEKIKGVIDPGDFDDIDVLMGVGPGTQSDTYRIYIDRTVVPHTLSVDARLRVNGSMVMYAKIFKGTVVGGESKVISAFYDPSGNMLGQNVPLELVSMPNHQNFAVKCVKPCYTSEDLVDGEVVWAVFYSNTGGVISKRQLLVENTGFIRTTDTAAKYIVGISLETPFLSESNPLVIQYPLNVPLQGMNLFGVVHYSDGTKLRMPVDGTKFQMFGFENFVATVIGQKTTLRLQYNYSPGEFGYHADMISDKFYSVGYQAITVKADGAYTVKLFAYPVWIDALNGYRLEFFLFNLDRRVWFRCSPFVSVDANSPAFNPVLYGVNQNISVTLDLSQINGMYKKYLHTQTLSVILIRPGTDTDGTNWTIGYDPGQNPPFGRNNKASSVFVNENFVKVRLDAGTSDFNTWLTRMYWDTKPLVDPTKEAEAPSPDFFSLTFDGSEVSVPISQWNSEILVNRPVPNASTLFVRFFKQTAEGDIQLSMSGMPVHQLN